MSEVELNPTVDGYRGSIGRLVFKKFRGRTIVGKKPVRTKEPGMEELAWREHFKEAVAYAKAAIADPDLRLYYLEMAWKVKQNKRPYDMAVRDYLQGNNLLLKRP